MKRLVVILLVATVAYAAPEKWFDAYARGLKAVNAKNYSAAAEALQKAISETPNEGIGVRAGNSLITYVPHFWLGIAKFNLGDVDGALREWSISEQQGVISRTEYYAGMKDWIARAQTEKVRNAEGAAKKPKSQADAAIRRALATQVEALSAGGDRTDTYRSADRKLKEALAQFSKAGTSIDAYRNAEETAGQAWTLFSKAAEEAKALKLARANAPKPQRPVVQQAVIPSKPIETAVPLESKPAPVVVQQAPPPPVAAEADVESEASVSARVNFQKYRAALTKAARDHRGSSEILAFLKAQEKESERIRQRLERAKGRDGDLQQIGKEAAERERTLFERITELRAAAAATAALSQPVDEPGDARAGLQTAYRAFAAGDLDTSEQLLTKIVTEAPSPEAYLLRGCARYTRAMLSRAPDTLLAGATSDFRHALQRNPRLRLDQRAFSPKLISFFEQVRVR
ncbi:MAG TPA: hypothetical protein VGF48_18240 [Thermoanaerobaculia bacterium]|jgi:hypothetical protein